MPQEIDTYFNLMDTDHDENLSFQEIEFGYAMFRYLISNLYVIIKDCTSQLHYPPRTQTHNVLRLFHAIDAHNPRASFISSELEGDGIKLEDFTRYIQTMN